MIGNSRPEVLEKAERAQVQVDKGRKIRFIAKEMGMSTGHLKQVLKRYNLRKELAGY